MRFRFLILTAVLLGGFVYLTSVAKWPRRFYAEAEGQPWSEPRVARGASLSVDEQNNVDIYKNSRLATVNVTSTVLRQNWFWELYPEQGSGSGFLIGADGRILTNSHVLGQGVRGTRGQITVTLADQSKYNAEVLQRDSANDLALLRISPKRKVTFLNLGDSDHVLVGQKVLAIGNPFGLDGTLTTGIVSAVGRSIRGENNTELEGMIQTDAAINHGNSGGPLLDSHGDVIGINTAILGPGGNIGIGFAMPINRAKSMLADIQAGRSFRRPRLGVSVVFVSGDFAEMLQLPTGGGLLIQEVTPGSAAEQAGLRGGRRAVIVGSQELLIGGDLIMAIDGKTVDRTDAIARAIARKRPGDLVELTISRGGRKSTVRVKLGESPEERL